MEDKDLERIAHRLEEIRASIAEQLWVIERMESCLYNKRWISLAEFDEIKKGN